MYGPPWYTNPPDDPRADRVAEIAGTLERKWMSDPKKLMAAANHVIGFTDYCDQVESDIAGLMLSADFEASAVQFARALVERVEKQIKQDAEEAAEEQEEREHRESEETRGDYLFERRRYG